jgi:1,4-alpha-glucan branching enzyme
MSMQVLRPFGAVPVEEELVEFRVWAPAAARVDVRVRGAEQPL